MSGIEICSSPQLRRHLMLDEQESPCPQLRAVAVACHGSKG